MIELHGWITVREDAETAAAEMLRQEASAVERIINSAKWFKPQIKVLNGEVYLEFTLFCNRRNPEVDEIISVCKAVSEEARESYGLVYLHDDEVADGADNRFQVFVISKGTFSKQSDPFLSPCIPVIEDGII